MARKILTEQLKLQVKEDYLTNKQTLTELAIKYNLSYPTISKILSGVPKYSKATLFNPDLNETYFDNIDSEEKAYFIGLLIADGNIYRSSDGSNRQDSISLTLLKEDKYVIEILKSRLKVNTTLVDDNRRSKKAVTLAIRSNKLSEALAKYGVVPNKTFKTFLPKINSIYMKDLIRGILDGDGSIRAKQTTKNNRFSKYLTICGNHLLIQNIVDYLNINFKLKTKLTTYDYPNKQLSEFRIQAAEDIITVGNWLYQDATIYLTRKKENFDLIVEHYKSKVIPS